jgi:hypothetical protein
MNKTTLKYITKKMLNVIWKVSPFYVMIVAFRTIKEALIEEPRSRRPNTILTWDAEHDTWFTGHPHECGGQPKKKEEPKYKMTPHKFE